MKTFPIKLAAVLLGAFLTFALLGAFRSTSSVQRGYPGVGMEYTESNQRLDEQAKVNALPPPLPPANQTGQLAVDAYKNVQLLGHLTSGDFTRLMTAITLWVSPVQGCAYCHAPKRDAAGKVLTNEDGYPLADENKMDSDEVYAKRAARKMLQMVWYVNTDWKRHVQATGVTCYTCHRGNPVPANIWFDQAPNPASASLLGESAGQNRPTVAAGFTSLPGDPFRPYLAGEEGVRILSTAALPIDNRSSIKQTEWTYALMMHMSRSLGVNCTYCHNTRSMAEWSLSPPARALAWHGIRLSRDLNKNYLEPLASIPLPPERLGPTGDVPKLNCATCHVGAYRPLLGQTMLKEYTALAEAKPQPPKSPPPPPAASSSTGAVVPPAAPATPAAPGPKP